MIRKLAVWVLDNVPVGPLAPHLLGWIIGSKPVKLEKHAGKRKANK